MYFHIPGLTPGATYYWRVDEVNDAQTPGVYAGPVWSFRTQEYTVVEDALLFRLNVDNVANKRYADTLYTGHYVPGKGRIVALTGTYKF